METQPIVITIILAYFILTVWIGIRASRNTVSADAFHGTQLSVAAIVCASCGEWLGGTATTGVAEYGYLYGLSGAWYTISNALGIFLLGMLFAKLYRSIGSVTVPGIIEHFFGINARMVSSILLIIVMLAVGISQMVAAGKLGQSLLGLDFTFSCIVFACIFTIYTLAGGMNAVATTNTMHLIVMYGGVILGVVLAIAKVGGVSELLSGLQAVDTAEGTNHFNMISIGWPKVSSWIIASILGAETAQAGLQPVLAAKDIPSAKKSCLITAAIVAPFGVFTALMGMAAKVMSARGILIGSDGVNVTDAKLAFSTMMLHLPKLASGIILASILAAILSTVSPIILASATLFTKDLYQRRIKQDATDAEIIRTSRIMTAVSGAVCCVSAIALVDSTTVLDLVYSAYSLRGALFVTILYGIYSKRISERAACWNMVFTGIVAVAWAAYKMGFGQYPLVVGNFAITETYAAVIAAVILAPIFSKIWPRKGALL
mgnify:CR=1 FL=1